MTKPTVVITGITRGIGLAVAERFAAGGYQVLGCGASAESCNALHQSHPHITAIPCDVTDKAQIQAFTAQVLARTPTIDVLVNNAGRFAPGQIHTEEDGVFESMVAVNVGSAYHVTRALLPTMLSRKSGTIINICSTASIVPYVNGSSYGIAKYALLGFSRILRQELMPHNIRVTSVLPGATLTDSWAGVDLPPQRFMQPSEIAEVVWTAATLPPTTVIEEVLLRPFLGDI